MDPEQRKFRADRVKVKRLRIAAGLTVEAFARAAILDKVPARKFLRGEPVFLKTFTKAAKALGVADHLELLHPDELRALGIEPERPASPRHVLEWEVEEYLSPWRTAANGLQFQVSRLRHRFLEGRRARGKCYELRHLAAQERAALEEHLRRHPAVCEKVGKHPNIAENLTAALVADGGHWWVLDRWEAGESLAKRLESGALPELDLKIVMTGVAQGLKALHAAGVVRRTLSPEGVLLRARDDSPVLTDFELAKLLGGRTVRPTEAWPEDPYRAPEVEGDAEVDHRADLYSWGRIFCQAAAGVLPEVGAEAPALEGTELPPAVRTIVGQCVAPARGSRPAAVHAVLKVMRSWKVR